MKKLNIGLAGLGRLGKEYGKNIQFQLDYIPNQGWNSNDDDKSNIHAGCNRTLFPYCDALNTFKRWIKRVKK